MFFCSRLNALLSLLSADDVSITVETTLTCNQDTRVKFVPVNFRRRVYLGPIEVGRDTDSLKIVAPSKDSGFQGCIPDVAIHDRHLPPSQVDHARVGDVVFSGLGDIGARKRGAVFIDNIGRPLICS